MSWPVSAFTGQMAAAQPQERLSHIRMSAFWEHRGSLLHCSSRLAEWRRKTRKPYLPADMVTDEKIALLPCLLFPDQGTSVHWENWRCHLYKNKNKKQNNNKNKGKPPVLPSIVCTPSYLMVYSDSTDSWHVLDQSWHFQGLFFLFYFFQIYWDVIDI